MEYNLFSSYLATPSQLPEDQWKKRIAKVETSIYRSIYIEENIKKDIFHDILQDLFSDNVKEEMRIQLLLFVEEYLEILIVDLDSAEQAFGALQNFYITNQGSNLTLLMSQVLISMTSICLVFNFKKECNHLHQKLVDTFLDTIFKVNNGNPLMRKTCSQCLLQLEDTNPGTLSEHLTNMLATTKEERSFVSYDHMLLLTYLIYGINKDSNDGQLRTELQTDVKKCISFVIGEIRTLSPTGLLQVVVKLLPCLDSGKIPKSLTNTLLTHSFQSWDLLLIYMSAYAHINYPSMLQQQQHGEPIMTLIVKLLLSMSLEQFRLEYVSLMHYWLRGSFRNFVESAQQNARYMALSYLKPSIYNKLYMLPITFDTIVSIVDSTSSGLPYEMQSSLLEIVLKNAQNIRSYRDTSAFFHGLFNLHTYGDGETKDRVLLLIEEIAVTTLKLVSNTINFCDSIERFCDKQCSLELLKKIMQRLLMLDTKEIIFKLKHFLAMVDCVASFKDIWPLPIIEKLRELIPFTSSCCWVEGVLLLSVCKKILITHGSDPRLRHAVACVLWDFSENFENSNLTDQAMFYYSIIGNLSPKYYHQVLVCPSTDKKEVNAKEVSAAIQAGFPSITELENNFLTFEMIQQPSSSDNRIHCIKEKGLLKSYRDALSVGEGYDRGITKLFRFKFKQLEDDDIPNEIYASQIIMETRGPFEKVPDIICPFLSRGTVLPMSTEGEVFPVKFLPKKSYPAVFDVSVKFTDVNNKCFQCSLPSFRLSFSHLMQKLPVLENKPDDLTLFDELWRDIEEHQKSEENPTSKRAISVKFLPNVKKTHILHALKEFLCEENDEGDVLKFGIYLPPLNNALFRVMLRNENALVKIAVDDFSYLDDIDQFFNEILVQKR